MSPHFFSSIIKRIFLIFLLASHSISYCDIVASTTILTPHGLIPIEDINVGDYVIGYENNALVNNEVINIASAETDTVFNIEMNQGIIQATKNQLFYDPNINKWVKAKNLTTNNTFLSSDLTHCSCQTITSSFQETTIYKISTKSPHNFFISDACILTHNNFFVIALSWAFGGGIEFVGATLGAVFGGTMIGAKIYNKHKKNKASFDFKVEIDPYSGGCFSDPHTDDYKTKGGCFPREDVRPQVTTCFPIAEVTRNNDVGCTIVIEQQKESNIGCALPKEEVKQLILCAENQKDTESETKRYEGPKYYRTEDWIREHPIGQEVEKSLERSRRVNQGKRAFEVVKKIDNCDGLKKGEYIVVDALHNDHLEVFDKHENWSHVANFDGSINYEKTKQAQKTSRRPLQKG